MQGQQEQQITLTALGRLTDVAQFEDVILKVSPDRRIVRVKDIGRVELGSKNDDVDVRFDGKPTTFLAIFQMPDANALQTRDRVVAKINELAESFPGGVVAVGCVLSAVFIPCAFIGGITGAFFRQFALTIAVSTLISTFNSLTLSPALTALLLRPVEKGATPPLPRLAFALLGGWLGWSF